MRGACFSLNVFMFIFADLLCLVPVLHEYGGLHWHCEMCMQCSQVFLYHGGRGGEGKGRGDYSIIISSFSSRDQVPSKQLWMVPECWNTEFYAQNLWEIWNYSILWCEMCVIWESCLWTLLTQFIALGLQFQVKVGSLKTVNHDWRGGGYLQGGESIFHLKLRRKALNCSIILMVW